LCFRKRELDAGRPLLSGSGKPMRAASIIHHLLNTLRVLRIHAGTGAVTMMDAGNPRVAKAQEAAERLLAKRLHTGCVRGVSIEPASWETMASVGQQLHQTFTIKIADSVAGPVKLRGVQLIKCRGTTPDGGAALWVHRGLQLPSDLAPGSEFPVAIWSRPDRLGMLSDVAVFSFEQSAVSFSIFRFVSVRCGDPDAEDLLKPSAPFTRKRRVTRARTTGIVEGRPPPAEERPPPYVRPLGAYGIPGPFRWAMEHAQHVAEEKLRELRREVTLAEGIEVECPETYQNQRHMQAQLRLVYTSKLPFISTACRLCQENKGAHHPITCTRTGETFIFCNDPRRILEHARCASYSHLYSNLLWAEEKAMEVDLRAFDLDAAPLVQVHFRLGAAMILSSSVHQLKEPAGPSCRSWPVY
jgi:hypothetical protein